MSKQCSQKWFKNKTHVEKCISCPKLVKDKYLAKLHVSTTSTTKNDSDETSEIENWPFDFSTSSAKPIPMKPKQIDARLTLVHFADKMSSTEQEKLNALLVRAMYISGTSFCVAENSQWQAFFKAIRPAYGVPSGYKVSEPLLVSEYEKTREEMLIKVAESDAVVAIMCDGWSNIRHEPNINFLLSVPQSVFWKSIHTEMQSHAGEYIAEAVSGVIDEVKQECGKMPIALVSDNASNMKKSLKLLGEKYSELTCYGCAAHSMNLIFGDLMKLETLKKVKNQAKQIVKEFKSKHMLVDLLKSMQKVEKGNVTLKLPVKTRWGSVVTCLESVQKTKVVLRKLAVSEISEKNTLKKVKNTLLDDDFWNVNEAVVNLLKPFFSAITQSEADVPNLAEVYKLYSNVRCKIRDNL